MSANDNTPWMTESLRLTLFPLIALQSAETVARLWRAISNGGSADESSSKASAATHLAHGAFLGGRLVIVAAPGRIDINYVAETQPAAAGQSVLGPYRDELEVFRAHARVALADCPAMHRLAVGGVFQKPAATRKEALEILKSFLPTVSVDAGTSVDLFYQINRPRMSAKVPGRTLNRLGKWTEQQMQVLGMNVSAIGATLTQTMIGVHSSARFEADVSTEPASDELPMAALRDLFDEMIGMVGDLAEKGDVP